jgi:hypothetical protein
MLGLACVLAAFIIIFQAVEDATSTTVSAYTVHRRLGIAAVSMGLSQLLALVARCGARLALCCASRPVQAIEGCMLTVVRCCALTTELGSLRCLSCPGSSLDARRPQPGTSLRLLWELVHHWVGRAVTIVAVANIYEGINVCNVDTWAVATYSAIFGLIAAVHLGLDVAKLATGRRKDWAKDWGARADSDDGTSAGRPSAPDGSSVGAQQSDKACLSLQNGFDLKYGP